MEESDLYLQEREKKGREAREEEKQDRAVST